MAGKKTRTIRAHKAKRLGASSKRKRENRGTTCQFPLTGEIPSTRYGMAVHPDKIVLPKS